MKKILTLIALVAIVVSCENKNSTQNESTAQDESFINEEAAVEDATMETVVNSVGAANAARFTLNNDDEIIGVVMDLGNMATAVVRSPEIGRLFLQGKWEIVEDQYKLTLMSPGCTEDEATIIIVPKSFDKGILTGSEEEYQLKDLELLKIEKVIERSVEENAAKDFIKKMYNERLFEDDQFLNAHCSPLLLGKLHDAYDYDDEQGLASWLFRSEDQDGPSDRHEIIKVESEGNNWYKYEFYDMGTKGSHRIKLILGTNDEIIIDDLE